MCNCCFHRMELSQVLNGPRLEPKQEQHDQNQQQTDQKKQDQQDQGQQLQDQVLYALPRTNTRYRPPGVEMKGCPAYAPTATQAVVNDDSNDYI